MSGARGLVLQVVAVPDDDAEVLEHLAAGLRTELLGLDVDAASTLEDQNPPGRAKGLGSLAGWLAVRFGTAEGLRAVVAAVRGWAARTSHVVEVTIGSDTLKVTGVTSAQQDKIIEAWLARHSTGT